MNFDVKRLKQSVKNLQPNLVSLAQKLIQTPSLPGYEADIAQLIQLEMQNLGYDDVIVDDYGNIIGRIKGGKGASIMFNGHMDHVDIGDESKWPYPPFRGQIVKGELWGRGAVDMKGALACMLYTPAVIKQMGMLPPGDVYVVNPVMEEAGGIGTSRLVQKFKTDLAVVGEPSGNTLRRGHRGRVEMWVSVAGKSIHASIPQQGVNPHYNIACIIQKLQSLDMPTDKLFGASNVAPTLYQSDQSSPNVTPGHIRLTLDWRNIPSETPEQILQKVETLLQQCLGNGASAKVALATRPFTTYTGVTLEHSAVFPSFVLEADDPFALNAQQALSLALQRDVPVDIWPFATDGGHLMAAGIPTVGFGPGDETLAHTNQERVLLTDLRDALVGYTALALTDWR
ncbi:MAG: hypothetical protein B6243_05640 [Anaerolineaceae bacterium 4572_5.2]|nr:MAG: hypothetical protein B6243_05640 [Anaerolineaceae bacterium 4572_5.2]